MSKLRRILTFALAMMISLGVVTDAARAQERDPNYWSGNDVLFYDPTYQQTCAAGGGSLRGGSTKEKIWNFLIANDLSPEQAAGLMGNMKKESQFSPVKWQRPDTTQNDPSVSNAWGLVQWDFGRRDAIIADIKKEKPELAKYITPEFGREYISEPRDDFPEVDFDAFLLIELDYLLQESRERDVKRSVDSRFPGESQKEWPRMQEQPTIRDATLFWERNFEISADNESQLQQRVTDAELIYDEFKDNLSAAGTGTTGCAGAEGIQELTLAYAWPEYISPLTEADRAMSPKPAYAEAVRAAQDAGKYVGGCNSSGCKAGIDCGGFVTLLITNSGHDPGYNYDGAGGNTTSQQSWMQANWDPVGGGSGKGGDFDTAELRPGDVAISATNDVAHTYVYVGDDEQFVAQFGGNGSTPGVASASIGGNWRAPMAGGESLSNPTYTWYTKRGGA